MKSLGGERGAILIQRKDKSLIIEEFGTTQVIPKTLPLRLMAMHAYWLLHGKAIVPSSRVQGVF